MDNHKYVNEVLKRRNRHINFSRRFFQIADLLYVFIAGPMEIVQLIASQFVNSGACKLAEYSRVLSGVASILNLLAVTTERYINDLLFINRYLKKKNITVIFLKVYCYCISNEITVHLHNDKLSKIFNCCLGIVIITCSTSFVDKGK